jgi:NADH-quinone oxidoreductase subunit J
MPQPLFYLFVAIMLGFAVAVVVLRNPVSSALSLVMSFVGLAALYISLNAYFVGILQILVYAGAVMVLFLFIIMLMDIQAETRRKLNKGAVVGGLALVLGLVLQVAAAAGGLKNSKVNLNSRQLDLPAVAATREAAGLKTATINNDLKEGTLPDAKLVGETLFTKYNLHLQMVGVILLVATVGVVVLSRREDRGAKGSGA